MEQKVSETWLAIHWLPLHHPCSHTIDWGVECDEKSGPSQSELGYLQELLSDVAFKNCPWCGSTVGKPSSNPKNGIVFLVSRPGILYRIAKPSLHEDGIKNEEVVSDLIGESEKIRRLQNRNIGIS